jgi:plastocyanin
VPPRPARKPAAWLLGAACACCVVSAYAHQERTRKQEAVALNSAASAANPSAAGGVAGRVTVPAGQRMPEMIIYLESTDPAFRFDPPAETVVVSQHNAKFEPGVVIVPVGTRVNFSNDEHKPIEHNVFSNSEPKKFDLGLYKPNEPVEPVLFDRPGAVRLRCSIHRYMDGVVFVTPTPYFANVGGDGSFSIEGVRPGNYELKTWQRSQRYRERAVPVEVAAGKPADVAVEMSRK